MGRTRTSIFSAKFGRALVALVCACALTIGVAGLSQARGAKGTQHTGSSPILIMVQPATAHAPAAICPYALLITVQVTKQESFSCPGAEIDAVSYTLSDEIAPSPLTYGTPFRPPRTA